MKFWLVEGREKKNSHQLLLPGRESNAPAQIVWDADTETGWVETGMLSIIA